MPPAPLIVPPIVSVPALTLIVLVTGSVIVPDQVLLPPRFFSVAPTVPLPSVSELPNVQPSPSRCSVVPPGTITVPLPSAPELATSRMPALTLVVPAYELLLPDRTSVPGPILVRLPALMVAAIRAG